MAGAELPPFVVALAGIVQRMPGAFVAGHVVLPTPAYFPERWAPTRAGLEALARRLHAYLGVGDLGVHVELDAPDESYRTLVETIVELESIEDDVARYRVHSLGRPEDAVYALLHEAARAADLRDRSGRGTGAFRDAAERASVLLPDDVEEAHEDASLLAVARGLGVLVVMGAHIYRQAGRIEGRSVTTEWQHAAYGGLAPEEASRLLALQLEVRPNVDRAAVLGHLSRERADEVRAALSELRAEPVAEWLGLPPKEEWPSAATLPVAPIVAPVVLPDEAPVGSAERRRKRAGQAGGQVYRLREPSGAGAMLRGIAMAVVLAGIGGLVGILLGRPWTFWLPFLGALLGAIVGTTRRHRPEGTAHSDVCSDPSCAATILPNVTLCPGCGRAIAGVVFSRGEAAERTWAAEERSEERGDRG